MQSNRLLGVGILLLAVAAVVAWQLGLVGGGPALQAPPAAPTAGAPSPAAAPLAPTATGDVPAGATAAAAGTGDQRVAVPASLAADEGKPALVGRVVGPDGQPIAGAAVVAAPGLAFANANGAMDFDSFDPSDFDDNEMAFDQSRMMTRLREQLALRTEVRTDSDGRFRVVAKGTSKGVGLRVLARGHKLLDKRFTRPADADFDVGTLALAKGAVVSGRVLDPAGNAIAGAHVGRVHEMEARMFGNLEIDMPELGEIETLRGGESVATDAQGRFELLHVTPGELTLRARHPDHPTAKSDAITVDVGREVRDVLLTMQRGGEIRGTVTGLPADVADLQVMAAKKPRTDADPTGMMAMFGGEMSEMLTEMGMAFGERTATIGKDGTFVLRGLARDTYRVWVGRNRAGFAGDSACSARVEAMPGGTVELRFEPGVSVTFLAVDAKTGAPIERLWVRHRLRGGGGFADMMGNMPRTGTEAHYPGGAVTVANLRPKAKQTLTLTIEGTGYGELERENLELPKTGALELGTLKLEPKPVVVVTVVDADTGRPVAGASVHLAPAGSVERNNPFGRLAMAGMTSGPQRGRTDREGRCTVNRFSDQEGTFDVDAQGYAPLVSDEIAFTADGPNAQTLQLHVGGSADVTVVDKADKAIAAVAVEHEAPGGESTTSKTDADGVARFTRLVPGTHSFRLGRPGGAMARMMAQATERDGADEVPWQTVEVASRATATLRIVKAPTAALRGVVRENGMPLAGARVAFREGEGGEENGRDFAEQMMGEFLSQGGEAGARNVKTDEQGRYVLAELPEGAHRLRITHKGRAMPAQVVVGLRNGDNTLDVELDMTAVRGVVRDPEGKPVDGARLRVRIAPKAAVDGEDVAGQIGEAMEGMLPGLNPAGASNAKSDAAGAFELRGVDPDVELIVSATAKGFAPTAARVTAARGTTATVPELKLGLAGKVKVTLASAPAFGGVQARYVGDGDAVPPVVQMLRKGKATLDGLRPGPWEITIEGAERRAEGSAKKQRVEVVAGQTVEVNF